MDKSKGTNQVEEGDPMACKSVLDGIDPDEWSRMSHKEQEAISEEYHQELRRNKRPKVVKTKGSSAKHTPPVRKKATEVLKLVSEGVVRVEIAKELNIGIATVDRIIKEAKQK